MSFELGLKILLALYVVVALAMIGLILLQRGQGAQAGSGFGSGASATVFGSRGSANFLSISTKWLAVLFFALSIGMGVYISRNSKAVPGATDLGVMGQADAAAGDAKAPVTGSPKCRWHRPRQAMCPPPQPMPACPQRAPMWKCQKRKWKAKPSRWSLLTEVSDRLQ
ncbi:MAG: preprotein translocase subunit SecG [Xanthomonadales bacterium]|nr:preprotein translocase subunit SecG [Xanthomonadales bacterium]